MGDLHDTTSWVRNAIKIMVRLRAGIWSETVAGELKSLFDTAKKLLRDEIFSSIGIDIHMDSPWSMMRKLSPWFLRGINRHFLSEAKFALSIVCHPDPSSEFDLPSAEPRLKRFQIWLVEIRPSFIQPDYVHPTLMHLIQLLTRPGALK